VFTLEYLRIRLITLKSEYINRISRRLHHRVNHYRVLLATIRNCGDCTCPWCTIPQKEFHKLGQHHDMKGRITRTRSYLGDLVENARECIYKSGYSVTAAGVEHMLKPFSLVPTMVRLAT
jgi:hypothetical protein